MPTRRRHSKSKKGCTECKKRHLKCDEALPACTKCRTTGRQCIYPLSPPRGDPPQNQQPAPAPPVSAYISSPVSGTSLSRQRWPASPETALDLGISDDTSHNQLDTYTLRHFQLLHNFDTLMLMDMSPVGMGRRKSFMDVALKFPFLVNQTLALSAAHMSTTDTGITSASVSASVLATEATDLQTRALAQFNEYWSKLSEARREATDQECLAGFLYSSLLGLHVMFDSFRSRPVGDFNAFLDRLTSCLSIQQGVVAMIGGYGGWDVIKEHIPLLLGGCSLEDFIEPVEESQKGRECDGLTVLLEGEDLGSEGLRACQETVGTLQWAFDVQRRISAWGSQHNLLAALAWMARLPAPFILLLRQRTPKSLVILGYFAVLLHSSAAHWAVGDAGRLIATGVATYLGSYWNGWLSWPLEAVGIGLRHSSND